MFTVVAVLLALATPAAAQLGGGPPLVTLDTAWSIPQADPGDQRALAVVLDIREGFHINPDPARTDDPYIPTTVQVTQAPPTLEVGPAQFPEPHHVPVAYTESGTILSYEGRIVIYVPVIVSEDAAPGPAELTLQVEYQACDESVCHPPRTETLQATLDIVGRDAPVTSADDAADADLFAGFDPSVFAAMEAGAIVQPDLVRLDFFGWQFELDAARPSGLALLLAVALAAGALLNFTPCVLPVVPLKVMSLHQQAAGGQRGRTLLLGAVFCLGIVACFLALGALVAGLTFGLRQFEWGEIFSYWWVSVGLAAIIVAMALGMFGLYTIQLPRSVFMLNPSHDTVTGNLLLGVLTAVLSTPCTGPMLGGAIAWAVKQPWHLGLGTFATMGVGMALPYLLLSANPHWVDHLPRTGPGSELVKQVMGGLLLAVAAFFLGPVIPGAAEWWVVTAIVVATAIWLAVRTLQITPRTGVRAVVLLLAVGLSAGMVTAATGLTREGPIRWQPFTEDAFLQARAEGKSVLLEFTADWCGNCKALELTVYRDPALAEFFHRPDYVAFQVDLTSRDNVEGWRWQRKLGAGGGIPLAAVYHPGDTDDAPSATFQGLFGADALIEALQRGE